eukprot:gnl/TRDRNA2_/TRDRNA2_153702_c0_seq1.p1 gnl/TRDRNA2_/TRDRNA2_153702_c0~~gnl/TRDRNA2_/TRDRNA2_153702_c0_seq1.p1  ORF type:complete len:125 (+),score=13.31 gnl/TRDRNA2_/TRDRNA2_153702_c0_seq1:1-375(+)
MPMTYFSEVKALIGPPGCIRLTAEAICKVLGIKPERERDPNDPSRFIENYWHVAKLNVFGKQPRVLAQELSDIDAGDFQAEVLFKRLKPYLENEDFVPERVFRCSHAMGVLCEYCHELGRALNR